MMGIKNGLTLQDAEILTWGMWMDYVIECVNAEIDVNSDTRKATQDDFDNF